MHPVRTDDREADREARETAHAAQELLRWPSRASPRAARSAPAHVAEGIPERGGVRVRRHRPTIRSGQRLVNRRAGPPESLRFREPAGSGHRARVGKARCAFGMRASQRLACDGVPCSTSGQGRRRENRSEEVEVDKASSTGKTARRLRCPDDARSPCGGHRPRRLRHPRRGDVGVVGLAVCEHLGAAHRRRIVVIGLPAFLADRLLKRTEANLGDARRARNGRGCLRNRAARARADARRRERDDEESVHARGRPLRASRLHHDGPARLLRRGGEPRASADSSSARSPRPASARGRAAQSRRPAQPLPRAPRVPRFASVRLRRRSARNAGNPRPRDDTDTINRAQTLEYGDADHPTSHPRARRSRRAQCPPHR